MFNILSHQGNANQYNSQIPSYTCQNAKIKNTNDSLYWRECGVRGNTPPLLVGLHTCTTTMENSMVVSQKIGNEPTEGSNNTTLRHISK